MEWTLFSEAFEFTCIKCQYTSKQTPPSMNKLMAIYYYCVPEGFKKMLRNIHSGSDLFEEKDLVNMLYLRCVCLNCLSSISFRGSDVPIQAGRIYVRRTFRYKKVPLYVYLHNENYMVLDFLKRKVVYVKPTELLCHQEAELRKMDEDYTIGDKILPFIGMTPRFLKDICLVDNPDKREFFYVDNTIRGTVPKTNYLEDLTTYEVEIGNFDRWSLTKVCTTACKTEGHKFKNSFKDLERRCYICQKSFFSRTILQMKRTRTYADAFRHLTSVRKW